MLKKADLPTTTFQLESIEKNLLNRKNEIQKTRKLIEDSFAIAENTPAVIKNFILEENRLVVAYEPPTPAALSEAKKRFPHAKMDQQAKTFSLEVAR